MLLVFNMHTCFIILEEVIICLPTQLFKRLSAQIFPEIPPVEIQSLVLVFTPPEAPLSKGMALRKEAHHDPKS